MPHAFKSLEHICAFNLCACSVFATTPSQPKPSGKLVELGGHQLHVNCTGKGNPTVVVENGLGDFSFDWTLVQSRVSGFTRVCTYDRAGYAWSDPGPKPRTFSQLNLELRDALGKLGEHGPFVLVGHSYGGPVIRNFAATYPHDVAGMILVDAAHEGLRVGTGGKRTIRLGDAATGRTIPAPHEEMSAEDKPMVKAEDLPGKLQTLDPMYKVLPAIEQRMHLWAQLLPAVYDAENGETEWSRVFREMAGHTTSWSLGHHSSSRSVTRRWRLQRFRFRHPRHANGERTQRGPSETCFAFEEQQTSHHSQRTRHESRSPRRCSRSDSRGS